MNKIIRLLVAAALTLTGITATATTTNGAGTPANQIIHYTHFGTAQRPGDTRSSTGTRTTLGDHDMIDQLFTNPTHRINA